MNRQFQKYFCVVLLLLLLVVLFCISACGHAPRQPTANNNTAQKIYIAQPCSSLKNKQSAAQSQEVHFFIEAADVISDDLPNPIGDWLNNHAVSANHIAGFMTQNHREVVIPWGKCRNIDCSETEWNLMVTPQLDPGKMDSLGLVIELKPQEGNKRKLLRTEVQTTDQQPVVVQFSDTQKDIFFLLVFTPYRINSHEEMGLLLQCKDKKKNL